MNLRAFISSLLFLSSAACAFGQTDASTVDKIIDEGKNHSRIMATLDHLTHRIGARLTSSENLDRAYEWTMSQFKRSGCKNVHLEEWGTYPVGFQRGRHQTARMTKPDKIDFVFTTPSWTMGTEGRRKGKAIAEPATLEAFEKVKKELKGAWLISPRGMGRRGTKLPDDVVKDRKSVV